MCTRYSDGIVNEFQTARARESEITKDSYNLSIRYIIGELRRNIIPF